MSDTIIVYENGKAIGGEGHPTNADEITFNNEDTDLVSEEVESAIKEVNAKFDRGSVSVTANGSKTYGTLFNELYALVDQSKITRTSKMSIGAEFASLDIFVLNERMFFSRVYATATTLGGVTYRVKPSGSEHLQSYLTGSPVILGLNNNTNNVPTNGTVITIYY